MADSAYGACSADRNTTFPFSLSSPAALGHPGIAQHPLITPDVQVSLLAAMDETGDATLADLADAIPAHPAPISAVLALIDCGLAELDPGAPFDAHLRVSRTPRR